MAQRLAAMSGIDDELIQSGENMLLTFTNIKNKVGGEFTGTFDRATGVMLDMSVAMDQDLKSSAIQIGKALNDPIAGLTSLTRVGVNFSEQTKKQIALLVKHGEVTKAQAIILDELTKEFGGSAEAQATASGKMMVALGNLAESVGKLVAPAFRFLFHQLTQVADWLQTNLPGIIDTAKAKWEELLAAVQPVADWFQQNVIPVLQAIAEWFGKVVEAVTPVAKKFGSELLEAATQVWQVIKENLWPILQDLWNVLQKLWHIIEPLVKAWLVIQGVWVKIALEVLPPLLAVIADLIEIILDVVDAFLTVVNWIKDHFVDPVVGAIEKVIDWIKDKFVGAWNAAFGPVSAVIGKIIEWIKTLVGWIQTAVEWLGKLGSSTPAVMTPGGAPAIAPHVNPPQAQTGGFVARSGLAMIHKGENIIPAGGGGDIVLQIDGQTIARIMRDQLNRMGARNATTGLLRP